LTIGEKDVPIALGASDLLTDLKAIRSHLLPLPVPEIERVIDAVSEKWSVATPPSPDARALTPPELLQLAGAEMVTIGAHTIDHVRLGDRSSQEQLDTITTSRKDLERFLGQSVSHFAYPFGRHGDFDERSVEAVRSAEFATACTSIPGTVRSSTDPYLLPRRSVMDWGRLRFQAQMQRWKLG
jgi:peptidoglycan/xylan/chitin deacetylase (PgdA/CDA1 family)